MKKRAHITISPTLHQQSCEYAESVLHSDFSGIVTRLLVEELAKRRLLESLTSPSDRLISELNRRIESAPLNSPLKEIAEDRRTGKEVQAASRDADVRPQANGRVVRGSKGQGRH